MNEDVLLEKIENLTKKVDEGFAGVHKRQDEANGKLTRHDNCINDLQKKDIRIEGKFRIWRMYWVITGALVSIIITLLGVYVF